MVKINLEFKVKNMYEIKSKSRSYTSPICLFLLLSVFSCKREANNSVINGKAKVTVTVTNSEFNNSENIGTKNASVHSQRAAVTAQRRIVPLDADFSLNVELSPAYGDQNEKTESVLRASNIKRAAAVQEDVASGVKYKVVVFDKSGGYVTDRDYVRGQESNGEELTLNGGQYTFIAYSINSTAENPALTFNDQSKTLDHTSISGLKGNADFMYYRTDLKVSSENDNYLSIIFNHKFSQIATVIDATSTGKNIEAIEASFDSHYPNADISLSDAGITRLGTKGNTALSFAGVNTGKVSATTILNGDATDGSLKISKLTIGGTTRTDIPAITNLTITPGVKYNLNLTVTRTDGNLLHAGLFSVRINGQIWMRHNLKADYNLDPDQNPSVRDLIGNYYQFGRSAVAATSSTGNGAISGWNTSSAPDGSWNSGTESNPVKTSNDPCPSGFRLPTRMEYEELIKNTTASNIGTWTNSSTANTIGAAKVFTSKTNPNVKLTFPAIGYRTAKDGQLTWRGGSGDYWTSSVSGSNLTRFSFVQNTVEIRTSNYNQPNNLGKTSGFTIRCISEQK